MRINATAHHIYTHTHTQDAHAYMPYVPIKLILVRNILSNVTKKFTINVEHLLRVGISQPYGLFTFKNTQLKSNF